MNKQASQSYEINAQGVLACAEQIPSPNQDERPSLCGADGTVTDGTVTDSAIIDMVVIHNISLPPKQYGGNGIIELFTNKLNPDEHPYYAGIYTATVSAHFLIRRDGALIQFVPCTQRAWHAGVSQWEGRERCNDFSVGIELEGCDFEAFEDVQYKVLNALLQSLKETYPIQHIVGHSDIAAGRKTDPGPFFDWDNIAEQTNV